ncbi:MAG: hypothetical protein HOE48_03375 [Candidatus Latescibacteria bacterium]|nr:hypothetical protein [Candidatus Latescibacterota bacterium]
MTVDSDTPALHSCMYDRTQFAARGFVGGKEGMPGELFLSDGTQLKPKGRYELHPGQAVTLRLPGGGGFYSALERDPQGVLDDVVQERVSVEAARDLYGVVVDLEVGKVDEQATALLRAKMSNA